MVANGEDIQNLCANPEAVESEAVSSSCSTVMLQPVRSHFALLRKTIGYPYSQNVLLLKITEFSIFTV